MTPTTSFRPQTNSLPPFSFSRSPNTLSKYTEVANELRSELHSKMEDSDEVQFKIFESINEVLSDSNHQDIFVEIQKNDQLKEIIGSHLPHSKL